MSDANGVGMRSEDDGDRVGRQPGRLDLGRRAREHDAGIHADQFGCRCVHLLDRVRPPVFDDQVLALDITEIAQARPEGLDTALRSSSGTETQKSDPPNSAGLLGARDQGPCRQYSAAEQQQIAPVHSMTSSARASSDCGTVSPSAFAVLRLMTNSNLVGCSTGRSAGLAPLRIFPA